MNYNTVLHRHRFKVSLHAALDAALFLFGFMAGFYLRLRENLWDQKLAQALPVILMAALMFICSAYITGAYDRSPDRARRSHVSALAVSLAITSTFMVVLLYVMGSRGVGRGVFLISALVAYALCLLHHLVGRYRGSVLLERTAILIAGPEDGNRVSQLARQWEKNFHFIGLIHLGPHRQGEQMKVLGPASQLIDIIDRERIQRIICSDEVLNNPALSRPLCAALFTGITVTTVLVVCEEVHQRIPLDLVTPEWLLSASSQPHRYYLAKVKRMFDIVISLALLTLSGPLLLLAILLVKLTSQGPVFYSQIRCGRSGKPIRITKLRTMRNDAERSGPVWSSSQDSRITPVGLILRNYRIDELLQLVSVLKGDMSFVGPRPERPEFMDLLENEIPGFKDRLLVQPGLTGWAQVNYPYGATVEDARHKLEFDLYYMKHMGISLDLFILLDTVRTVLRGGVTKLPGGLRTAPATSRGTVPILGCGSKAAT